MSSRWFGPDGLLQGRLEGYRPRQAQTDLALAIEEVIDAQGQLVAEAGTGVGKTFAYLVPALLSGKRVMVSTASRTLQDQLFERDVPRLCKAMGLAHIRVARLKGRANYLCPFRIARAQTEARFGSAQESADFREVVRFAAISGDGDISGCHSVPEHSAIWPLVTSTTENCLGQACPQLSECPVVRAREAAAQAELLIVNHHLLCADFALKREHGGDLLPAAEVMIIDEAHALADCAGQFFGLALSTPALAVLCRELLAAGLTHARDAADWPAHSSAIELANLKLRESLAGSLVSQGSRATRITWTDLSESVREALTQAIDALTASLCAVAEVLAVNAARDAELLRLKERVDEMLARVEQLVPTHQADPDGVAGVYWIEVNRTSVSLHWAPVEVAMLLRQVFQGGPPRSWIFVSATLAVPAAEGQHALGDFQYFCGRMGLAPTRCLRLESPFDYSEHALLVVPQNLPDPKSSRLVLDLLGDPQIMDLIVASPGGVFVLCTSLRAVDQAGEFLRAAQNQVGDRLVLVQGQAPRASLLEAFRTHGRAILVGAASFWEGVDVPGQALSLVMIDKLPFSPPDDPVLEARMRQCREAGGDPFREIQLPEASLALKQGAGRLIRSEHDRGVLLIGDRRLAETPYGRRMARSLPPFRRTRSLAEARQFFPELKA